MRSKYKEAWDRLPERFRKINNLKLYYVLYGGFDEVYKAFEEIRASRDLDKAFGKTLDKIGENVGQFRMDEDDDLYRQLIKVRIIANLSLGNIPTLNKVLSVLTKDVYLGLKEVWDKPEYQNEPSKIVIELGSTAKKFPFEIVEAIKSAGVRVLTEIHYDSKLDEIWAGGRRRVLKLTYHEYQVTDIKGEADNIFAGRLISIIRKEWPINKQYNLIAKGQGGYLTSDIGAVRGEIIE
jgi:hypothetical protein